jgi:hypothetical protein
MELSKNAQTAALLGSIGMSSGAVYYTYKKTSELQVKVDATYELVSKAVPQLTAIADKGWVEARLNAQLALINQHKADFDDLKAEIEAISRSLKKMHKAMKSLNHDVDITLPRANGVASKSSRHKRSDDDGSDSEGSASGSEDSEPRSRRRNRRKPAKSTSQRLNPSQISQLAES